VWSWEFIRADGTVKPQGTWTDALRIESAGGRRVGRRTQQQLLPDGRKIVTVNVFDLETLAPLERDWRVFDGRFTHVEFRGREVERQAVRKPGEPPQTERAVLPEKVFDFNGGMYGLLLRAPADTPAAGALDPQLIGPGALRFHRSVRADEFPAPHVVVRLERGAGDGLISGRHDTARRSASRQCGGHQRLGQPSHVPTNRLRLRPFPDGLFKAAC